MSKEAVDAGLNFMVNITNDGFLGEGATENVAYLNKVCSMYYSRLIFNKRRGKLRFSL